MARYRRGRRSQAAAVLPLLPLPLLLLLAGVAGCSEPAELIWYEEDGYRWAEVSPGFLGRTGFAERTASRTGLDFENRLTESQIADTWNYLNGSGVAAGDVDGDGWTDLYFAGLGSPNRLYRNVRGLRFEDVTAAAGVAEEGRFSTSAVFADVDGDGDLDLVVGSLHQGVTLHVNDGAGRFTPLPGAGLESTAHKGTMTLALADVDSDGSLDLYVTNYRESHPWTRESAEPDQLFLNDGTGRFRQADGLDHFLDADGRPMGPPPDWGLAARFQDLNGDGRPDLYVANDYFTTDRTWINQGGGVFRATEPDAIRSASYASMAVDFSDIDRDGTVDIFTTEMLSPLHERRLRQNISREPSPRIPGVGARPQYQRNSLFVGRGDGTWVETSYFSGVEATGWSWAAQFLDVDLDGYEDLLVNTGFLYDLLDMDTLLRVSGALMEGSRAADSSSLREHPPLRLANKALRNEGDLTFTDVSSDWGFRDEDVSQGLAVGDLDHDGDLDLVVNRLNAPAALYENTGRAPRIAVRLVGLPPNTQAIGAEVELQGGPVWQSKQIVSGGAYLSGSDPLVVFAAGAQDADHTLRVRWPGGASSVIHGLRANRIYEVDEPDSVVAFETERHAPDPTPAFEDVTARIGGVQDAGIGPQNPFAGSQRQPLLPFGRIPQGPGVSWIDFDRDGDSDLFVTSGPSGKLAVFRNQADGTFQTIALDSLALLTPGDPAPLIRRSPGNPTSVLGWATGDGSRLVVGSANLERVGFGPSALVYTLRDGRIVGEQEIPPFPSATGPLAAADYDGDGILDLFVGGGFVPGRWPEAATSRLFTDENGTLVLDPTNTPSLAELGLVTGAVFTDYDQDADPDLLLSLEWGSLRLFRNDDGTFHDVTRSVGLASYQGWWNGVATGDFDGDGRPDIVATNLGQNSAYRPLPDHPLRTYYDDFNFDGRVDVVEAYFNRPAGGYVPRRQLPDYMATIPTAVTRRVKTHREFAAATLEEIFGRGVSRMHFREINTVENMIFLNRGDRFEAKPLPREAQLTIAFSPVVGDYDNDGAEDLFLSQNLFPMRAEVPPLDGGRGLWLKGDGEGGFRPVSGAVSGVEIWGEQRGAALADFDADGRIDLAVAQDAAPTRLYRNRSPRAGLVVRLVGPAANRDGIGAQVRLVYADGDKGPLREVQAGSGRWSQNAAVQVLGEESGRGVIAIEVRWPDGRLQRVGVQSGRRRYTINHPS